MNYPVYTACFHQSCVFRVLKSRGKFFYWVKLGSGHSNISNITEVKAITLQAVHSRGKQLVLEIQTGELAR